MKLVKKQRIGVSYTALDVSTEIIPYGGVPDRQVYDSATGGYTPDFEMTPLCLFPKCIASNSRDTGASGSDSTDYVNDSTNFTFSWFELTFDSATGKWTKGNAIVSGKNGYEIVQNSEDGLVRGMLKVNKNAPVGNPIRLEFDGTYVDAESGQVYRYVVQKNIMCDDMEETVPELSVTPVSSIWNPVKESPIVKFEAMLVDGVHKDITSASNVRFDWYRKVNVQGISYDLQPIDGTHIEDVDVVEISQKTAIVDGKETIVQGNSLTINRDMVGDGEMYVCKAMRRASLSSSDKYGDRDPYVELSCTRQMPVVDVKIIGLTNTSDSMLDAVSPRAVLSVNGELLTDEQIDKFYRLYWTVRKPNETEDKVVSNEISPTIPFVPGMTIGLGYEERGAQMLLMADNGSYMTDENGAMLFAN